MFFQLPKSSFLGEEHCAHLGLVRDYSHMFFMLSLTRTIKLLVNRGDYKIKKKGKLQLSTHSIPIFQLTFVSPSHRVHLLRERNHYLPICTFNATLSASAYNIHIHTTNLRPLNDSAQFTFSFPGTDTQMNFIVKNSQKEQNKNSLATTTRMKNLSTKPQARSAESESARLSVYCAHSAFFFFFFYLFIIS